MTTVNTSDRTETSDDSSTTADDARAKSSVRADQRERADQQSRAFQVSWFDAVSSSFLALMLLLGTLVAMLTIVWLIDAEATGELPEPIQVRRVSMARPVGPATDFLEPELVEVERLVDLEVQDLLSTIQQSASLVVNAWDGVISDVVTPGEGEDPEGATLSAGPPFDEDGVPAFQRWQLNFSAGNLDSYARQLDFFRIELGVIGGSVQGVDYVSDLSTSLSTRRGDGETEQRLYFMWNQPGPLMHYDRRLLSRAGVELPGREMLKFIPPELENRLTQVELEYARSVGRDSLSGIAKTIFESKPAGNGYQFKVIDQRYRRPRK